MALAVGLHIAAMFPAYPGNPANPVVAAPDETAIYICMEVGWALAAVLVLSRLSLRGGIALGAALGAVEIGFLITDTASGLQVSSDAAPGIWLAWGGLGIGLAGVCLGASSVRMGQASNGLPRPSFVVRAAITVPVAVTAVAAFWPSWDHYRLVSTSGRTFDITVGNAFSQANGVMAGEVVAGLAIGVVAIVAALWSPPDVGAWATAGVVIALSSQLVSGVVQVHEPLSATLGTNLSGINVSASSLSLTGWWGVDLAAVVALACLALWAALESRQPAPSSGAVVVPLSDRWRLDHGREEVWPGRERWPSP